jgi:hypothetical protein
MEGKPPAVLYIGFIPGILFSKDAFMLSSQSTTVGTQIIEATLLD